MIVEWYLRVIKSTCKFIHIISIYSRNNSDVFRRCVKIVAVALVQLYALTNNKEEEEDVFLDFLI